MAWYLDRFTPDFGKCFSFRVDTDICPILEQCGSFDCWVFQENLGECLHDAWMIASDDWLFQRIVMH
jgi:hypothetical protein